MLCMAPNVHTETRRCEKTHSNSKLVPLVFKIILQITNFSVSFVINAKD